MGFSAEAVATFIAVVGVLSVFAQTAVLGTGKNISHSLRTHVYCYFLHTFRSTYENCWSQSHYPDWVGF